MFNINVVGHACEHGGLWPFKNAGVTARFPMLA